MAYWSRHAGLLFSLLATIYLTVFALPSAIRQKKAVKPETVAVASIQTEDPIGIPQPKLIPFKTEAIQIKASGEEVFAPDERLKAYLTARKALERKLGSLDQVYSGKPIHYDFEVPEALKGMVNFWVQIFSQYGKNQFVFHDRDHVEIVYSVLDLSFLEAEGSAVKPAEVEAQKNRYLAQERQRVSLYLKNLAAKVEKKETLNEQESRVASIFSGVPGASIATAADPENIHIQSGFSHRFRDAIALSGRYMQEMENIFTMKGLPVELTRLPLIESAFELNAVSSASAVGVWQFMPDSARRYLNVDEYADERRDPILATYAAAKHLKADYDLLGSWPLAINAYNTGAGRLLKAIRDLETTDIETIITNFKEPGYQFYSRNYYPEFLAALHVYENQVQYFGKVQPAPTWVYDLYFPQEDVDLRALADLARVPDDEIRRLNPALTEEVLAGLKPVPAGALVRVPKDRGKTFQALESFAVDTESERLLKPAVARKDVLVDEDEDFIVHTDEAGVADGVALNPSLTPAIP